MEKQELAIAIISIILLGIVVFSFLKFYISEREGFSKENIECNLLSFIPFICSEEDLQKLQQLSPQAQQTKFESDQKALLDHIIDLYKTCGTNSALKKCRCELNYDLLKENRLQIDIISMPDDNIKFNVNQISATYPLGKVYVDNLEPRSSNAIPRIHTLKDIKKYNTNSIHLGYKAVSGGEWYARLFGSKDEPWFYVKIYNSEQQWRFSPPEKQDGEGRIGILKEDNKIGLYIPYTGSFKEFSDDAPALISKYPLPENVPLC